MASSGSITSTRNPTIACWCRWAILAPPTTRSASPWTPRRTRRSPSGPSSSRMPSAPPRAFATRRKPRDCRRPCSTWRRPLRPSQPRRPRSARSRDRRPRRPAACSSPPIASSASSPSTTKSASVQYRFNERAMTYLSWSEGFKSGGFNQRYNAAPPGNAPISFGAETAESFELGLKLDPSDTLRVNLAAVQHGLRRHPDDVPAGRGSAAVQRRRRVHRRWRARAGIPAHRRFPARYVAWAISIPSSTASRRRRPLVR